MPPPPNPPVFPLLANTRRAVNLGTRTRTRVISGITAVNHYKTGPGGAMAGNVGGGFGLVTMFRLKSLPTGVQVLRRFLLGNSGWQILSSGALLYGAFYNSAGGVNTPGFSLTHADVGRLHVLLMRITATPNTIEACFNGWQSGGVSLGTYVAPQTTNPEFLGIDEGLAYPASSYELVAAGAYLGSPSAAQIAAYTAQAIAAGDLPYAFPGAAVSSNILLNRYSLADALGTSVVSDGQVAPATLINTYDNSASAARNMYRQGSPVVRVYYSRNGDKMYGLGAVDAGCRYQSAASTIGGGPFVFTLQMKMNGAPPTAGNVYLARYAMGVNAGWIFYSGPGSYLSLLVQETSASNGYKNATYYLTANELGRDLYVTLEFTGTVARLYIDGVVVASVALTAHVASPAPITAGAYNDGTSPQHSATIIAITGKDGATTASEIAAHVADSRLRGRLQRMPGAQRHWDFDLDIRNGAGPNALPPATVTERVSGTDPLTRVGTGLTVGRRTEWTNAFEADPVSGGFMANGAGNYYQSSASGHDGGAANGKSVALLFRYDSQTVNKSRELLSIGAAGQRMGIRANGAMSSISSQWFTGSAWANTATIVLSANDIGKMLLYVTQFDKGISRARSFWKRLEQSAPGASMASFAPLTGQHVRLGHLQESASYPTYFAEETTIFGAATFDGVWSYAEICALFDGVAAEDDLILLPGRMDHRWSFKESIGGSGVLPSLLLNTASQSSTMSQVGTPAYKAHYAHGPALGAVI